jgi:apolipoprotein N-acyltransferase
MAFLSAALIVVGLAVLTAAPWLDQQFVWCAWLGAAGGLMLAGRIRGWRGEACALLAATLALTLAFHWTPEVLAYAMNTDYEIALLIAAPILIWDAIRLALPFWFVSRVEMDPLRAWLPAGLLATVVESITPTVFPWKLGYSQAAWLPVIQSVDLFGPEFSTFVLFAHAGLIVWLIHLARSRMAPNARPLGSAMAWQTPATSMLAVAVCVTNVAYGLAAMAFWSSEAASAPTIAVALVQANPEEEGGVDALRSLTTRLCADRHSAPDFICWPESSGGCYEADLDSLADPERVAAASRGPNTCIRPLDDPACPLLFGGKTFYGHPEKPRAIYQSAILIDSRQQILGRYHKRHLMPFGEYVPGETVYPEIKRYFAMQEKLTEGTVPTVLEPVEGARAGVMLCYEDMISKAARTLVAADANVLISLINGSAFTQSLTLRQHRLLAQLRAVECRRVLLRCAATGETCVVAATGAVEKRLQLHDRAVLLAHVPLLRGRTLYGLTGRVFPFIAAAVLLMRFVVPSGGRARGGSGSGDRETMRMAVATTGAFKSGHVVDCTFAWDRGDEPPLSPARA